MNFLSHFYFERKHNLPYQTIGTVLPDLVKNADKNINLHPQKHPELFTPHPDLEAILRGWERHLEVDLHFHSSEFFLHHTKAFKEILIPILSESPVRPSFLAHIGVELLLDHLLVLNYKVDINSFYEQLDEVAERPLKDFLTRSGYENTDHFFAFFRSYKSSRYLFSYQKIENISYALQRICMRLWEHPFSETSLARLTDGLSQYQSSQSENYLEIFDEIEQKLKFK